VNDHAAIVILLGIGFISYRQTITAYPNGGDFYTVARENLRYGLGFAGRRRSVGFRSQSFSGPSQLRRSALDREPQLAGSGRFRAKRAGPAVRIHLAPPASPQFSGVLV
jgi:hypothetical protein